VVEKLTTYWHVRTGSDAAGAPDWKQLDGPPATTAGLHGELKVENDDQIRMIYFADEQAQERVTRAVRDAASLAPEWQIRTNPQRGAEGPDTRLRERA
jgi:hypothetical protein